MNAKQPSFFETESILLAAFLAEKKQEHANKHHSRENLAHQNDEITTFISLDEVGRGCIAGPVVVCATLWSRKAIEPHFAKWLNLLRDSKKLSLTARERAVLMAVQEKIVAPEDLPAIPPSVSLETSVAHSKSPTIEPKDLQKPSTQFRWNAEQIKFLLKRKNKPALATNHSAFVLQCASIGSATAQEIDSFGIEPALGLAGSRALESIGKTLHPQPAVVFFDGHRPLALTAPWTSLPQVLITKGDDLLKSISASSVLAKVVRDRWMETYAKEFPNYFFEEHRGYGTIKHQSALLQNGISPLHRRTFLKNIYPQSHS